ncbi:AMP-binding protein [Sphingomonas montanisoli]|uniref:AMP-binding protein n=1 Tax=Sphingomonas montanisoli TaxID=2606412 RepID=A0A5D9C8M5_9SPHN|nr:AMP-binding protein [Sphingomonas montanisoli]TZG27696.1 AMP-binding protein [Sphingomonas montanisoli]
MASLDTVVATAFEGDPDGIAIEYKDQVVRWGDMKRVADAVNGLLDEAGIGPCTPVAFIPESTPAFAATLLGLFAGRRTISMIYGFQAPAVIASDMVKLNAPAYIAALDAWAPEMLAALPEGAIAIGIADALDPEPVRHLQGSLTADRSHLRESTGEPVVELLSSGTTGAPKRQPTRYSTIYAAIIEGNMLDAGAVDGQTLPPGIVQFPFSNISGIYSLVPYAVARRKVRLLSRFNLPEWLDFAQTYKPAAMILPAAGVRTLLDSDLPDDALAGVGYISMGMTGLDHGLWRAFEKRFGVPILYSYGATEFAGAAAYMTADLHKRFGETKFGTAGRADPRVKLRVVDQNDPTKVLGPNEEGLLEVLVPYVGPDWIRTTDIVVIDEDDFLFIRGRADGAISRGGFKMMPGPIEAALLEHPSVAVACVVGAPDPRLGQVPAAVIELKEGASAPTEEELQQIVRGKLPSTNVPAIVRFIDRMPRTQSLKVDLGAVRAMFADKKEEAAA